MGFLNKILQAQRQAQGEVPTPAPRPTLIQGGPAFFTPEGYVPPVQPEQAFMPTDVMRDPIADMFAAQPPLNRVPGPPKMIDPPKPPDQIFIDDMPPMREEPPMDFPQPMPNPVITPMPNEDMVPFIPPIDIPMNIDRPRIRGLEDRDIMNDFMSIGGPGGGFDNRLDLIPQVPQDPQPIPQDPPIMPPIMPPMREVPPEDFGFGPGIRRSEDFFKGEDLIMPPMAPPKPLGEDVPPMPMENIIRANDPAIMPMSAKMPMLPEPMPMPSPMPIRPRMPMPGPIATPMPMAPINLPKIELPKIDRNEPMMPRSRGIESLYSPRMMAEGGEVVDTPEEIGLFDDTPLANYILSLQSPERSEIVNNLIGVSGIAVGSAESIPMFIKRLIQTGSLTKPEVEEVIQESLEKNTSQ